MMSIVRNRKKATRVVWKLLLCAIMTEFLVCFNCCIGDQPQTKRHPRLDRKMIGEPMNFVHITHFGTKEMANNPPSILKRSPVLKGWANSGTDEFQRGLQQQFYEYTGLGDVQISWQHPSN